MLLHRRRALAAPLGLIAAAAFVIGANGKFEAPPKTSAERIMRTVDPAKKNLLGGGKATAEGHGLPMQGQPSSVPIPELAETPSWENFYTEYVRKNRPVVLRGHTARTQPAFKLWTDEYLAQKWGDMEVTAEVWKSEFRNGPTTNMKMRKFLKAIHQKKHRNQLYAVIPFDNDEAAKSDFFFPEPIRCKEILPQSLTLWMSAGGTTSVLHEDDGENFLMLLAGTKDVMLVHQDQGQHIYTHAARVHGTSPVFQDSVDHEAFPDFAKVQWERATLEAGDTLYIPHSYWHQVNSRGRNLAANVWWGHKEDWRWWNPQNSSEYSVSKFGTKDAIPFDRLKARSPERPLPCTMLPDGETLAKKAFVDEGDFKEWLAKQRRKHKTELYRNEL